MIDTLTVRMQRTVRRFLPLTAGVLLAAGAAQAATSPGWEECGEATWYGANHAGRRTSTGEVFDPAALTAAHATLPLGTRIRVTMQETGASVVVRVNDRQPYHSERVIDLSRGAAGRIGLLGQGVGMVTLSAIGPGEELEVAEARDTDVPLSRAATRPGSRKSAIRPRAKPL